MIKSSCNTSTCRWIQIEHEKILFSSSAPSVFLASRLLWGQERPQVIWGRTVAEFRRGGGEESDTTTGTCTSSPQATQQKAKKGRSCKSGVHPLRQESNSVAELAAEQHYTAGTGSPRSALQYTGGRSPEAQILHFRFRTSPFSRTCGLSVDRWGVLFVLPPLPAAVAAAATDMD